MITGWQSGSLFLLHYYQENLKTCRMWAYEANALYFGNLYHVEITSHDTIHDTKIKCTGQMCHFEFPDISNRNRNTILCVTGARVVWLLRRLASIEVIRIIISIRSYWGQLELCNFKTTDQFGKFVVHKSMQGNYNLKNCLRLRL